MAQYFVVSNFLASHLGYHCEACLAQRISFSLDEVRAGVALEEWGDITIAYGICQTCLSGKKLLRDGTLAHRTVNAAPLRSAIVTAHYSERGERSGASM